MSIGLWARWMAMHGVPRAFMKVQAKRGDPLARLLAGHGRDDGVYPLMEEIRAHGPLLRTPFTWVKAEGWQSNLRLKPEKGLTFINVGPTSVRNVERGGSRSRA